MRYLLILLGVLALGALAFVGVIYWKYTRLFPEVSTKVVQLTPEKRSLLESLRRETKFRAHRLPPGGYTGAETPEDAVRATDAVNGVIDAVLAQPDGPVAAKTVSRLIGKATRQTFWLATRDRERTVEYLLEVWSRPGSSLTARLIQYPPAIPNRFRPAGPRRISHGPSASSARPRTASQRTYPWVSCCMIC